MYVMMSECVFSVTISPAYQSCSFSLMRSSSCVQAFTDQTHELTVQEKHSKCFIHINPLTSYKQTSLYEQTLI